MLCLVCCKLVYVGDVFFLLAQEKWIWIFMYLLLSIFFVIKKMVGVYLGVKEKSAPY